MIYPTWEVFDECPKCFAPKYKPCYSLKSTTKRLTELVAPHRGRKQLKDD